MNNGSVARTLSVSERDVDLQSVNCVWYRRKLFFNPPEELARDQRRYVAGEVINLIEGMVADPSILWVNPIDSVQLAERKVYQLRLAQQLGFMIPNTLISNAPNQLRSFSNENKGDVICKPIFHGLFVSNSERAAVYTHRVKVEDLDNDLQLTVCPTLLQQEIPKGTDIRVTFIGGDVFPVEIYADKSKPLDWRRQKDPVSYRLYDLNEDVENSCKVMLKMMGLSFGAFDFVKTEEGQLYFLEINPTGEWAWLEKEMGFPMRDAFVRLFYS